MVEMTRKSQSLFILVSIVYLSAGLMESFFPVMVLVILLVSCVAAILVASKIYENSLLRMGARVKLSEALRG